MASRTQLDERRELLETKLEQDEEGLRDAVGTLREAARSRLVMGERVEDDLGWWLAGAFLFGLWLGLREDR